MRRSAFARGIGVRSSCLPVCVVSAVFDCHRFAPAVAAALFCAATGSRAGPLQHGLVSPEAKSTRAMTQVGGTPGARPTVSGAAIAWHATKGTSARATRGGFIHASSHQLTCQHQANAPHWYRGEDTRRVQKGRLWCNHGAMSRRRQSAVKCLLRTLHASPGVYYCPARLAGVRVQNGLAASSRV